MLSPSRASAIIVYDITDAQSFENARGWFSQLRMLGEPGVVVGLAGSKADLASSSVDAGLSVHEVVELALPKLPGGGSTSDEFK